MEIRIQCEGGVGNVGTSCTGGGHSETGFDGTVIA